MSIINWAQLLSMNSLASLRLFTLILILGLTGCGGGGNSAAANGGIGGSGITGGTGSGEITAFGSVIFGDSTFAIDNDTEFTIDGVSAIESDLRVGMMATFEVGDDASSDLTSGTAQRIDAFTMIKGIVTNVTPFEVLGQPIVVTGDTLLDNVPNNDIANLLSTDIVEIYGFTGSDNIVHATRIERKTLTGLIEWKLTGIASSVTATTLNIGAQLVNINGVAIDDCTGGLVDGNFVEIKTDPNAGFVSGNTLNMVIEVECQLQSIPVPASPSTTIIPAQFEGVVSGFTSGGNLDFSIGGQLVEFTNTTEFLGGTLEDLVNGTRLEVEGLFDTSSFVLAANKIKFKQTRILIEAPVNPGDITAGASLDILGLTVIGTAATKDDDGILSMGISVTQQVEVKGFIDSNGTIFAEEVRGRGTADSNAIRLRGPVANISSPNFDILGVSVGAAGAAAYLDLEEAPINIAAFFGLLSDGVIVAVEDAQLNIGPALSMDVDSTVQLED